MRSSAFVASGVLNMVSRSLYCCDDLGTSKKFVSSKDAFWLIDCTSCPSLGVLATSAVEGSEYCIHISTGRSAVTVLAPIAAYAEVMSGAAANAISMPTRRIVIACADDANLV